MIQAGDTPLVRNLPFSDLKHQVCLAQQVGFSAPERTNLLCELPITGLSVPSRKASFIDEFESSAEEFSLKWCASCSKECVAKTQMKPTRSTFWSSVTIFFLGGFLGCFLLPYMVNACNEVEYVCETCGHSI